LRFFACKNLRRGENEGPAKTTEKGKGVKGHKPKV